MKILAINGSPRGKQSNTDRLLLPFLQGAQQAGAESEVVYLCDKEIKHCLGCFACWTKNPGVCVQHDDMPALLEQVRQADMLVYATPLYVFTVPGLMKDFMDRLALPILQPYIVERNGQYIHPRRYETDLPGKIVLISNCGFPERHHFAGLDETFRCMTRSPDVELVGEIFCAGGELLRQPALQESVAWYVEAAREAGRQVVQNGHISPETQVLLDRPLIQDPAIYATMANAAWRSEGVAPVAQAGNPSPAPSSTPLGPPRSRDTMRDLVAGMAISFNTRAAKGLKAVIQFDVTDQEPSRYYLDIADGTCTAFEGTAPNPTLTIHTPAEVWMAISRGELKGPAAMMAGKYSVTGNLGLLLRFNKLFSAPPES